jgi:hypothetical protein
MTFLKTKFKEYKGAVGFVLLLIGTVIAVHGNTEALNDSKDRGLKARAVICDIITEGDEQSIRQAPASAKLLHIDQAVLNEYLKKQLETSAHYRAQLAPSTPASACEHGLTKLKPEPTPGPPILPPRITITAKK